MELKSAETYYNKLTNTFFNDINVGLLHGRMSWQEKENIMLQFKAHKFNVLISTTVIEVGIDIPDANIILINDAHRFGLSQLHQLRGRVGRSDKQAYCILVTTDNLASKQNFGELELDYLSTSQIEKYKAAIRLQTLVKNVDGFKIAEVDLKLRGPGDIFGTEQSGFPDLKFADLTEDYELIIKTKKIDIVHTHLVHAGILGKIAAKIAGIKHVVSTRHYGYHYKENTFLYRLEQRLTRSVSVVIAISEAVKKYLTQKNVIPEERIVVIHNAIDLKAINTDPVTPTIQKKSGTFIIGSIGRLHPQKGFDILLESFKLISKQIPNLILEIIGDGILHNDLQNQAKRLNITDKVRFVGCMPHRAVLQKLSQWDLYIVSSLWEGFGIAIIEAMAKEKAVVATNVEGIAEVVDDGSTGYLVPPKSPIALARKITELLSDTTKGLEMGKAGKEKVLNQFSIEKLVEKNRKIYDSLLLGR
ncbi:glycosyltransferase [candidate division KSB1 bacterium]|nr:glycosyltransferase [candidate division KSB1 bacterium]